MPLPASCSGCFHSYNAGILDGEGSICCVDRPNGRGAALFISITNTDLRLLRPFLVYGGKLQKVRVHGLGRKPQHTWQAYSDSAHNVLTALHPYLKRLRKKAKIGLVILNATPRKGQHLSNRQARQIKHARKKFHAAK